MVASKRALVLGLAILICTLGLSGCCSIGIKKCSTNDQLTLIGDEDLNKCNNTGSTPVSVQVYYLKQKAAFLGAGFDELWTSPSVILKSDMIGDARDLTVTPTGSVVFQGTRPVDATYLGVIADFCEANESRRKVITLDKNGLMKTIKLYQHRLTETN